ncbi:MAG: carboxypeptidase-like regulatory domain-containing protein [Gemmatimonadota bacterium]
MRLLAGDVVEGVLELPLPGAMVLVDGRVDGQPWKSVTSVVAGAAGRYEFCLDPSIGDSVRLRASLLGSLGEAVRVALIDLLGESAREIRLSVYLDQDHATRASGASVTTRGVAGGRFRVFGTVTDMEGGEPIVGAWVRLARGDAETVTSSDGSFSLLAVMAVDTIMIEHFGYKPGRAEIAPLSGTGVMVDARLPPQPLEMEPIVVGVSYHPRLRASGFYERRKWGERLSIGVFLGEKDIRREATNRISYLIERVPMMETLRICTPVCLTLPKVSTAPDKYGGSAQSGYFRSPCPAEVYVNGSRVRMFFYDQDNRLVVHTGIDELGLPSELVGIEVYRRASELPAEFGGATDGCGAVVIWTK